MMQKILPAGNRSRGKARWATAASWLFLALTFGGLCLFMQLHIDRLLDSDMSAELILAKVLQEEGHFALTENWYYPSEVRVFHFQLVMARLFGLFSDWRTVRVVGSVIMYLLYLTSYYYFCTQAGLKKSFPVTAAFLLLPFSAEYFAVFLYGLFYIPHMILAFLILGMLFRLRRGNISAALSVFLIFSVGGLSLLGGLGGQRVPAVLHAPLVLAALLYFVLRRWFYPWLAAAERKKDAYTLALAVYAAACAFAGLGINQLLFSQKYTFRSYQFVKLCKPSFYQLAKVLEGWLRTLGLWTPRSVWPSDWPTSGELQLSAYSPLQVAVSIVLALALCAAFWHFLRPGALMQADFEAWFTAAFLFCGGVLLTGLFFVTTMEFTVRYLLTTTVFAIPLLAMLFRDVPLAPQVIKVSAGVLLCLSLANCASYYAAFGQLDLTKEERQVTQALEEAGCTKGYSTFWHGDVLTELSDGKIEVWVWSDESLWNGSKEPELFIWNQRASHSSSQPDGKCFVLLTREEAEYFAIGQKMQEQNLAFETERYLLYIYDSSDALWKAISES